MARRRGERIKVYVALSESKKYGFQTQEWVHTQHKEALGQTQYAGAAGVFFGANAPKPPRASFEDVAGTVSSFCSAAKVSELKKKDGWSVSNKTTIRGVRTAGKTRTVYVEMPGNWKYAWNMQKDEVDNAAELGITLAAGGDAGDLIWGVQNPKPPRASKKTAGGRVSTFVKPQASVMDNAAANGWTISSVDYDLVPNA